MTNLCDDEPTSDVLQLRESWTRGGGLSKENTMVPEL